MRLYALTPLLSHEHCEHYYAHNSSYSMLKRYVCVHIFCGVRQRRAADGLCLPRTHPHDAGTHTPRCASRPGINGNNWRKRVRFNLIDLCKGVFNQQQTLIEFLADEKEVDEVVAFLPLLLAEDLVFQYLRHPRQCVLSHTRCNRPDVALSRIVHDLSSTASWPVHPPSRRPQSPVRPLPLALVQALNQRRAGVFLLGTQCSHTNGT